MEETVYKLRHKNGYSIAEGTDLKKLVVENKKNLSFLAFIHPWEVEHDLSGLDLSDADFHGATIWDINFDGCNLRGANFISAQVDHSVSLLGADLTGATMPDGYSFEEFIARVPKLLAGGQRPIEQVMEAWGNHLCDECPMAKAYNILAYENSPDLTEIEFDDPRLAADIMLFMLLYDNNLIPKPEI